MSFLALAALTAIPALTSIINTVISGKSHSPYGKRPNLKKKKKPYVKRPTANPAVRTGKGKGQYIEYKRKPEVSYSHPWPVQTNSRSNSSFERLL
jgi:hypothetical protein